MNGSVNDNRWILWSPSAELTEVSAKEIIYSKGFFKISTPFSFVFHYICISLYQILSNLIIA